MTDYAAGVKVRSVLLVSEKQTAQCLWHLIFNSNFFALGGEEGSNTYVRTWCKKLRIFRNLWCVRTDIKRGWVSVDILRTRGEGEGSVFTILCRCVLWTGLLLHMTIDLLHLLENTC